MVLVPENMEMLQRHQIFTEAELRSRYEISLENYVRTVRIEALTMADMAKKEILPAILGYTDRVAAGLNEKEKTSAMLGFRAERKRLEKLSLLADDIDDAVDALEESIDSRAGEEITAQAYYIRDAVLENMAALRVLCDEAEGLVPAACWPFPTYGDLLFGV